MSKMLAFVAVLVICSIPLSDSIKCFNCFGTKGVCEERVVCSKDMAVQSAKKLKEIKIHHEVDFDKAGTKFRCFHTAARNTILNDYTFKGCIFDNHAKDLCKTNATSHHDPTGPILIKCYVCSWDRCNEFSGVEPYNKLPSAFLLVISFVITRP